MGKKKILTSESKGQTIGPRSDETLAYLNAITSISVFTQDGREIRTTVQRLEDVMNKEKETRRREGRNRKNP